MCTKEEVQSIASETEDRMVAYVNKSHQGLATSISGFGNDLNSMRHDMRALIEKLDAHIEQSELRTEQMQVLKDVAESYKAFQRVGSFTKWSASVAISLGGMYIFFEQIIKHLASKP
jgi:N12 class adenine-specific DNA methylase